MSLSPFGFRSCYAVGAKLCVPAISFFLVTQALLRWAVVGTPSLSPLLLPSRYPKHSPGTPHFTGRQAVHRTLCCGGQRLPPGPLPTEPLKMSPSFAHSDHMSFHLPDSSHNRHSTNSACFILAQPSLGCLGKLS